MVCNFNNCKKEACKNSGFDRIQTCTFHVQQPTSIWDEKGPIPLLHELFEASFLQLLKSQPTLLCLLKYVIKLPIRKKQKTSQGTNKNWLNTLSCKKMLTLQNLDEGCKVKERTPNELHLMLKNVLGREVVK